MIHLVYVSSAVRELSEDELFGLLAQSRDRNKRQNVTGMLLYCGGNFFQALEGEAEDVENIYDSILRDRRNTGNIVILKESIEERTFPNWSMGFKRINDTDADIMESYSSFMDKNIEPDELLNRSGEVLDLLRLFKQGN